MTTTNTWIKAKPITPQRHNNVYFDYNGEEYRFGNSEAISSGTPMAKYCADRLGKGGYVWRGYAEKSSHNPQGYNYELYAIHDTNTNEILITGEIKG